MKKVFLAAILSLLVILSAGVTSVSAAGDSWTAADWKPHNYVLSEGFGLNARKVSIRSNVSYANDQLTVSGTTSKGGIGVTFVPEVELDGFSLELSLDSWQANSTDRWFGITFLDKGEKTDIYNEVPFWSKHSESWSNDYGAGTLFAWRPHATPGVLQIQFNNIGIEHSYLDANTLELNPNAGKYADGVLGWSGYLSTIQLCNTDWTPMTDYSQVKITIREITDAETGLKGYAFDLNDGYWYRTDDSIVWPTPETDEALYNQLDINQNGELDDWERDLFKYGPAYKDTGHGDTYTSWVPYANWGDPLYSLYNFDQLVREHGGRLYLSVLYKDAFDMMEGEARFTVKTVNGKAATSSETTDLNAAKTVEANGISATVEAENTYAGVYPSMLTGLVAKAADQADIADLQSAIDAKKSALGVNTAEAVTFAGQVLLSGETKEVAIVSDLTIRYDTAGKNDFKVCKVTGTDLDDVAVTMDGTIATFEIKNSDSVYLLMYNGEGGGGCGSAAVSVGTLAVMLCAAVLIRIKK